MGLFSFKWTFCLLPSYFSVQLTFPFFPYPSPSPASHLSASPLGSLLCLPTHFSAFLKQLPASVALPKPKAGVPCTPELGLRLLVHLWHQHIPPTKVPWTLGLLCEEWGFGRGSTYPLTTLLRKAGTLVDTKVLFQVFRKLSNTLQN